MYTEIEKGISKETHCQVACIIYGLYFVVKIGKSKKKMKLDIKTWNI